MGIQLNIIRQFKDNDFEQHFKNELQYLKKINKLANQGIVDKERELLYRERLSTTKQLTGSFLFALLVCVVIILLKIIIVGVLSYSSYPIYILYIGFVGLGFWYAQKEIIRRQDSWQNSRINFNDYE